MTNFVNLHRLTADRTSRIDEREELRFVERMRREGLVTRFAEILLRTIGMSVFAEVRRTAVRTFEHWVLPPWGVVSLFRIQQY